MFLLFHIAVPLIVFEIPQIKNRFEFNRLALIIGSIFPDIIDKPFLLLSLGSGRGISHTLLFAIVSFLILFLITRGNKPVSISFLIGIIAHLLLDLPEIPLFFPFINYDFYILDDPLGEWIHTLFNNPIVFATEIIGLSILVIILLMNKLYNIKQITNYFIKTHSQKTRYEKIITI